MVYERSEKPISLRESLAEGIRNGDVNRVRELIEAGADVNAKKPSGFPIMEYATDECMLRLLIDNGADLNSRWRDGSTWLHSASLGDFHEAEMLLRHGADPNARDDDDETPLFAAEHARRADIAELLVSHGANVDAQNNDGWTALHGAVVGGSYEVAKVLLRFGANVELCDKEGDTPLIMAANMYHV
jgi:ankyrin repeat protein